MSFCTLSLFPVDVSIDSLPNHYYFFFGVLLTYVCVSFFALTFFDAF